MDLTKETQETRFALVGLAVLISAFILLDHLVVRSFLLIGIVFFVAKAVFHGSAVLILKAPERITIPLQVAIAIVAQILLGLIILRGSTLQLLPLDHFTSPWFWGMVGIITYVCHSLGKDNGLVSKEAPVRAYLVATAILFVICWMGSMGVVSCDTGYEDDGFCIDRERGRDPTNKARYFVQYLIYSSAAYSGILTGQCLRRK